MAQNPNQMETNDEAITEVLVEEKKRVHGSIRSQLDILRRTRVARGGVGAPLQVPGHLRDVASGNPIIVTDADLSPNRRVSREETEDNDADLARRINQAESEE